MRMHTAVYGFLLLLAVAAAGCSSDSGSPVSSTALVIDADAGAGMFLDTVTVDSVWVSDGSLKIRVQYGGGCEDHTFRLVGSDQFQPVPAPVSAASLFSAYPILPVYLIHDGHGDACRSLVSRTLSFDVSAASRLRREQLDQDGFITLAVNSLAAADVVTVHFAIFHTGVETSPRADVEAERIAAFRTRQVTADDATYARVRDDLKAIRDGYGDEVTKSGRPLGDVTFQLPWVPRELQLAFDDTTADAIVSGAYHDWDGLNGALGVEAVEYVTAYPEFVVRLHFAPEVNVCVLTAVYGGLPGLLRPPAPAYLAGDYPNIYAGFTDAGMSYLVEEAWGDCPAGCLNADDWFFESANGEIVFRGRYDPAAGGPLPAWWDAAMSNVDYYRSQCPGK